MRSQETLESFWHRGLRILESYDSQGHYVRRFEKLHKWFMKSGVEERLKMAVKGLRKFRDRPEIVTLACALVPAFEGIAVVGTLQLGRQILDKLWRGADIVDLVYSIFNACVFAVFAYYLGKKLHVALCQQENFWALIPTEKEIDRWFYR